LVHKSQFQGSKRISTKNDPLTEKIIGAAIEVHKHLGPGLLESAYKECLCHELVLQGIEFRRQQPVPVIYKSRQLDCGFRIDLVVQNELIIEIKAVTKFLPIHEAQLLTYMKLTGVSTGLLINFNVRLLKTGIRRFVL
jgi:GxxExxY protein